MARGRRGANATEVALLMPAFAGLLLGLFDAGKYMLEASMVGDVTRMACREGSLRLPEDQPAAVAQQTVLLLLRQRGYACANSGDCVVTAVVSEDMLTCSTDVLLGPGKGILRIMPDRARVTDVRRLEVSFD